MSNCPKEVRKGDIGTKFIIEFVEWNETTELDEPVPLAGGTITFYFLKVVADTVVNMSATILNNPGTDGKAVYTTVADDLDELGKWQLQGKLVNGDGEWGSEIAEFEVFDNLWSTP